MKKKDIPFEKWDRGGICDVCNGSLAKGRAYKVPVNVFYGSKKYKKWLTTNPMMDLIKLAGGGGADEFLSRAKSRDQTTHSAVCQSCIHLFM